MGGGGRTVGGGRIGGKWGDYAWNEKSPFGSSRVIEGKAPRGRKIKLRSMVRVTNIT